MTKTFIGRHEIDERSVSPHLRVDDLIAFLSAKGRLSKCPHCTYEGGWEISMTSGTEGTAENPELGIYQVPTLEGLFHSAAGMTCPQCGHFALISTYRIRAFLDEKEKPNG